MIQNNQSFIDRNRPSQLFLNAEHIPKLAFGCVKGCRQAGNNTRLKDDINDEAYRCAQFAERVNHHYCASQNQHSPASIHPAQPATYPVFFL